MIGGTLTEVGFIPAVLGAVLAGAKLLGAVGAALGTVGASIGGIYWGYETLQELFRDGDDQELTLAPASGPWATYYRERIAALDAHARGLDGIDRTRLLTSLAAIAEALPTEAALTIETALRELEKRHFGAARPTAWAAFIAPPTGAATLAAALIPGPTGAIASTLIEHGTQQPSSPSPSSPPPSPPTDPPAPAPWSPTPAPRVTLRSVLLLGGAGLGLFFVLRAISKRGLA